MVLGVEVAKHNLKSVDEYMIRQMIIKNNRKSQICNGRFEGTWK